MTTPSRQPTARSRLQFTLREMLLWTTALCMVLGLGFAWGLVAGYAAFSLCVLAGIGWYMRPAGPSAAALFVTSVILAIGFMVFILPAINAVRGPTPRNACLNHVRNIAVAINNYESANGKFPPAYTVDANGRRMHSWRTLILPYMEHQSLYNQMDLSIPWNAPANWPVTDQCLPIYQCVDHPRRGQGNFTSYVAVVGPETMWPGEKSRRAREVTDGLGKTLLIIEIARTDIAWAEPRDLTVDEILAAYDAGDITGMASFHAGEVTVNGFADVHTRVMVPSEIDRDTLRAMLTVAGGEIYEQDAPEEPPSYIPSGRQPEPPKPDAKPPTNDASREPEAAP